ncbi:MAG: hypothetical protein P8N50_01250, partial [Actinomycetota bacterium]|nr:hypothetical protein [Actinomycetota bacterium]
MSTEADALDRSKLERKSRDELMQIATALGVGVTARANKADIVDAILGDSDNETSAEDAGGKGPTVRRTRVRSTGGRTVEEPVEEGPGVPEPEVKAPDVEGPAEEPKAEWETDVDDGGADSIGGDPSTEGSGPSSQPRDDNAAGDGQSRRRRRRGRDRDEQFQGEPLPVEGTLDLRDEGYGFMRTKGFLASREDVYVPAKLVRQLGLRKGDVITGTSRPAARNEKNPALMRVETVNGLEPEEARARRAFDDLTPVFPDSKLKLEVADGSDNVTGRVIDLLAPIGKGQRGLIVAPPKAGKTTV